MKVLRSDAQSTVINCTIEDAPVDNEFTTGNGHSFIAVVSDEDSAEIKEYFDGTTSDPNEDRYFVKWSNSYAQVLECYKVRERKNIKVNPEFYQFAYFGVSAMPKVKAMLGIQGYSNTEIIKETEDE